MRSGLFLVLFLLAVVVSAQDEAPKEKNVRFGFGWTIAANFLEPERAESYGIAQTGMTWIDFYFRLNFVKYITVDGGLAVSNFKDKLPFTQAVTFVSGPLSGLPSDAKSKIVSGGFYYAIGGQFPVYKKLNILGKYGQWNFSATRKITNCTNCDRVELGVAAGPYLEGGLSYTVEEVEGRVDIYLTYRHYLQDDFIGTAGLGFVMLF